MNPKFEDQEIREHLSKILQSASFKNSPQLRGFLSYVVNETLDGNPDGVKEYTIAVNALNREHNFSPKTTPVVRVLAGRLRNALEKYYQQEGRGDILVIQIPKGTYVPEFVEHKEKITSLSTDTNLHKSTSESKTLLAVVPFKEQNIPRAYGLLGENLGQELSNYIGEYTEFSILSYYVSKMAGDIAGLLREGVKFCVLGFLRFKENELNVSVELVDLATKRQVWGHSFFFDVSSPYDLIEKHITEQIVYYLIGGHGKINQALANTFAKDKEVHQSLIRQYAYALTWRHISYQTAQTFRNAKNIVGKALRNHEESSTLWSLEAFLKGWEYANDSANNGRLLDEMDHALNLALTYDHKSQLAHLMSLYNAQLLNNPQFILNEAEKVIKLNPFDMTLVSHVGFHLCVAGDFDRGVPLFIDNIGNLPDWFHLVNALFLIKNSMLVEAQKTIQMSSGITYQRHLFSAVVYAELGEKVEAKSELAAAGYLLPLVNTDLKRVVQTITLDQYLREVILSALHKIQ